MKTGDKCPDCGNPIEQFHYNFICRNCGWQDVEKIQ